MKINLPKINCTRQVNMKPFTFGGLGTSGNGSVWQTPCSEFISKELRTPEVSDSFYANSPANGQQQCVEDLNLGINFHFRLFSNFSFIFRVIARLKPKLTIFCIMFTDNLNRGISGNSGDFWRTYSAYTSGYQSVDHLSDIDEFEENFKVTYI